MLKLTKLFNGPFKVDLPEDMLQSMVSDEPVFTSPMIFRIATENQIRYVGVREFTAQPGELSLNAQLAAQMGVEVGDSVSVERQELPKGSELTLDVLTGYTADVDLKSLLESWIPKNYTALAIDDELHIDYLGNQHRLKVASFQPEGAEAICVLDTDMDLIVNDSNIVGSAHLTQNEDIHSIELDHPVTSTNVLVGTTPANVDHLYFHSTELAVIGPEHATSESSFVAVSNDEEVKVPIDLVGPRFAVLGSGELTVSTKLVTTTAADTNEEKRACEFCGKRVPAQNYILHTNFCARNSVSCPDCGRKFGQTKHIPESHVKWHEITRHQSMACAAEGCTYQALSSADLGLHRATKCPGKSILCQFCHLLVPQGETTAVDKALGLTAHESQCGNRTTNCYICQKRVRLRSLDTHIKDHDMQRKLRPTPQMCSNRNCPNPYPQAPEGLCSACFGPLSVPGSNNDSEKVRQRILRRYVLQMTRGCNKPWCNNKYCATNSKRTAKEAMELTQQIMHGQTHWFCVDQESTQRRMFVDFDENNSYALGWRALAISQCGSETEAAQWLLANAN